MKCILVVENDPGTRKYYTALLFCMALINGQGRMQKDSRIGR